jgi:hypothetical protein
MKMEREGASVRRLRRSLLAGLASLVVALSIWSPGVANADQAPMWESPVGLAPGAPGSRVQMSAEDVHIQVREKDDLVFASVVANFDMLSPGQNSQLLVGFPGFASEAIPSDIQQPFSPVMFQPSSITNFRASSSLGQYTASVRKVNVGAYSQTDWFVWSMLFPASEPLRVQVAYDQQLDGQGGWAPVSYVLRTGALWNGPIRLATITMTAESGGLIGGIPAPQSAEGGLTWSMSNFKPTQDIDATYIRSARWRQFQPAVAAASAPQPSVSDLVNGATSVMDVMIGTDRSSPNWRRSLRGQPPVLTDRYFPLARAWAGLATEMDPSNWVAWELVGDIAAVSATDRHGWFYCWPAAAADAYQQAAGLGSPTADVKSTELADNRAEQQRSMNDTPQDCTD